MRINDFNDCFDKAAPTSAQKQRMLTAILEANNENRGYETMNRNKKRFTTAVVLAAAFVLLTATALAVGLGWHESLVEYFGIGEEQAALLDDAVETPDISVTDNSVTVKVLHTISDGNGLYVIFEIAGVEYTNYDEFLLLSEQFGSIGFDLFMFDVSVEYNEGYGSTIYTLEILSATEDKITGIVHFQASFPIIDGTLKLTVKDIGYTIWNYQETPDSVDENFVYNKFITVIEGEWILKWDFEYSDITKKIMPDEVIGTSNPAVVTEISISPISFLMKSHGVLRNAINDAEIKLIFKDGSEILVYSSVGPVNNSMGSSTLADEENMIYEHRRYTRFDSTIDPDDVVSVIIGNITIPVG